MDLDGKQVARFNDNVGEVVNSMPTIIKNMKALKKLNLSNKPSKVDNRVEIKTPTVKLKKKKVVMAMNNSDLKGIKKLITEGNDSLSVKSNYQLREEISKITSEIAQDRLSKKAVNKKTIERRKYLMSLMTSISEKQDELGESIADTARGTKESLGDILDDVSLAIKNGIKKKGVAVKNSIKKTAVFMKNKTASFVKEASLYNLTKRTAKKSKKLVKRSSVVRKASNLKKAITDKKVEIKDRLSKKITESKLYKKVGADRIKLKRDADKKRTSRLDARENEKDEPKVKVVTKEKKKENEKKDTKVTAKITTLTKTISKINGKVDTLVDSQKVKQTKTKKVDVSKSLKETNENINKRMDTLTDTLEGLGKSIKSVETIVKQAPKQVQAKATSGSNLNTQTQTTSPKPRQRNS
jgi:hypothetical protein